MYGSADTEYLTTHEDDRTKRKAIGTYEKSGESQYTKSKGGISYGTGPNFPSNWEPRYALAAGVAAMPDHRENYKVNKDGPRVATVKLNGEYYANPKDSEGGFIVNGTLAPSEAVGVHSLTDVPVYAMGPCQETFGGTYNNVDIFYKMASCLGLARSDNGGCKSKA